MNLTKINVFHVVAAIVILNLSSRPIHALHLRVNEEEVDRNMERFDLVKAGLSDVV